MELVSLASLLVIICCVVYLVKSFNESAQQQVDQDSKREEQKDRHEEWERTMRIAPEDCPYQELHEQLDYPRSMWWYHKAKKDSAKHREFQGHKAGK